MTYIPFNFVISRGPIFFEEFTSLAAFHLTKTTSRQVWRPLLCVDVAKRQDGGVCGRDEWDW
jgi:hypothetical protein